MAAKQNVKNNSVSDNQKRNARTLSDLDADDMFDGDDDVGEIEAMSGSDNKKLTVRRRIEDHMEEKRLREQLQDIFS